MNVKFGIAGIGSLVFSLMGKINLLVIFFFVCIVLDYVSGTLAAIKKKQWSASKAATGIWKKVGSIFAVIVGIILDLLLQTIEMQFPDLDLPLSGHPIFCCLVLIWYIATELGSITENAGKMGAPVPKFLLANLEGIKTALDKKSPKSGSKSGNNKETKKK
jgi:toxin secretion/phage lysis holin